MSIELFANQAITNVTDGGTTAPAPGTIETWTVSSSSGFPAAVAGVSQFHVCDTATGKTGEIIAVTAVSGTSWTVTRGADGTTPVAHVTGFTVQQVVSAGFLGSVPVTDWVNVAQSPYFADTSGSTDATSVIQSAIDAVGGAGGGVVYFPAGTYKLTSGLTVGDHNVTLLGDGAGDGFASNLTILNQTSTSDNGITVSDAWNFIMQGIAVTGPGSGTGIGIALDYTSPPSGFNGFEDVYVTAFGSHGIYFEEVIMTSLTRVWAEANGGWGIYIAGGTSISCNSCWARSNTTGGWFASGNYIAWNGCGADANTGPGWKLSGCQSCSIAGCGSENNTGNCLWFTASSFACSVAGFWCSNAAVGLQVDATCFRICVSGFVETALPGATASISVASGGIVTLITPQVTTATSFASGGPFVNQIVDNGITLGGELTTFSFGTRIRTATTSGTLTTLDHTVLVNGSGLTQTLPSAAAYSGQIITVKLVASGTGTVATSSAQTIDGVSTYALTSQYKYVNVQSNGGQWYIVGNN